MNYDAILVVSFGGPESPDDVIPFLENVLRGRNVPRERMLAVAEHYYHFEGKSPINQQTRELIAALENELAQHGPNLPVYWGNRNWHPMLAETLQRMKKDGIRRALAFVTSAYSSYSGCRQYREDIRSRAGRSWSRRSADRQAARVLQPSRIRGGHRRPAARCAGPGSCRCTPQRSDRLRRAQHPAVDGEHMRLCSAVGRSKKSWSRRAGRHQ